MTKHPNAHILQRLAELAQTTNKPWEHFEWEVKPGIWHPCSDSFSFACTEIEVRERIHDPITINGVTLEGPMTEAPEIGTDYWLLHDTYPSVPCQWDAIPIEYGRLKEGRIFRTREARDAVQAELTKLLKGEVE